ncbi:hypothetical protein BDP27DRAFT_929715 [Rhodocollybia butyracea]|uniref:Uncharacterized protein n=1 Tax=Rhodocollybia butyracea TaxID=206335 RepID=A0A9P5PKD9_9AGAR|nr:hypothetical protein BDP27DRAFT_929715 [Rhodocollybia butyracea]
MGPPTKVAKQGLHNAESVRISRPPPKLRRRAEVNEKLGRTSSTPDQKVESPSIPIPSSLALPTMNINDTSKPEHLGYDGVHAPAGPQDFSLVSVHETENSNAIETSPLMSHTLRVRPNLEILLNPQSRELGNEKDDGALPLSLSRLLTAVSTQATVFSEPNHEDPEPAIAVPSSTVVAVSESTNIKPACISSQSVSPLTTNSNQSSELPIFTTDDTAHLEVCFAYPRSNPETQDASTGIGEPPAKSNVGNKENVQWSFITREQESTLKIKELEAKVESDSHQKSLELETLRVKLENAILDRDTALKKLEFALKENAIVVSSRDAAAEAVNQAEKALDLSQQEKNAIMLERDAAVEAFGQAEQELRDYREYFRLKAKLLIAHTS